MRPSPARAAFAAVGIAAGLGLGTACTKEKAEPAAPPSSAAPTGGPETSAPNSVPPGVSGEGSKGGTGQGQGTP